MRRQVGFLIEKRDGRREWLRATKLARSIRAALYAVDVADDWLGTDLAAAVIAGLRARGEAGAVRSEAIADAAARVLVAAGQAPAAVAYASTRAERDRRRAALAGARSAAPASVGAGLTGGFLDQSLHRGSTDVRRDS